MLGVFGYNSVLLAPSVGVLRFPPYLFFSFVTLALQVVRILWALSAEALSMSSVFVSTSLHWFRIYEKPVGAVGHGTSKASTVFRFSSVASFLCQLSGSYAAVSGGVVM